MIPEMFNPSGKSIHYVVSSSFVKIVGPEFVTLNLSKFIDGWAPITVLATLYSPSYPPARCGGLRGAGGMSTDAKIAANIERGF